jgi:hypothetical protein
MRMCVGASAFPLSCRWILSVSAGRGKRRAVQGSSGAAQNEPAPDIAEVPGGKLMPSSCSAASATLGSSARGSKAMFFVTRAALQERAIAAMRASRHRRKRGEPGSPSAELC